MLDAASYTECVPTLMTLHHAITLPVTKFVIMT